MKVILKQDVKELGKKDTLVDVSDGYARNFLMPRKLCVEANASNMNDMKNKQQSEAAKKQKELDQAKALAAKLNDQKLVIKAKSGESGKLFGAISNKDIAEEIKATLNLIIDKKKIILDEPIKALGRFEIEARIYHGVIAKFNVSIESL